MLNVGIFRMNGRISPPAVRVRSHISLPLTDVERMSIEDLPGRWGPWQQGKEDGREQDGLVINAQMRFF